MRKLFTLGNIMNETEIHENGVYMIIDVNGYPSKRKCEVVNNELVPILMPNERLNIYTNSMSIIDIK